MKFLHQYSITPRSEPQKSEIQPFSKTVKKSKVYLQLYKIFTNSLTVQLTLTEQVIETQIKCT